MQNAATGVYQRSFYNLKDRALIKEHLLEFVCNRKQIVESYLRRLFEIKAVLEKSDFFQSHEVIGSSLLLIHDCDNPILNEPNIWVIDFGKTRKLIPNQLHENHHRGVWEGPQSQEDGFLLGLDNLISVFQEMEISLIK